MPNDLNRKMLANYNMAIHVPKGIGAWRQLYLKYLEKVVVDSVIEVGAGAPDFLKLLNASKKMAIDTGNRWEKEFQEQGIEFIKVDLDSDPLPNIGPWDVAVCSDVFEHLLYPDRTLKFLRDILDVEGFLFSHVPNEFTWKRTVKIMMGRSNSLYFHPHCEEFNDPHLHRFTKIGFEKFLRRQFKFNLYISDLRYRRIAKICKRLRIAVPYTLEGGPTFISTNSEKRFLELKKVKKHIF